MGVLRAGEVLRAWDALRVEALRGDALRVVAEPRVWDASRAGVLRGDAPLVEGVLRVEVVP